MTYIEYVNELIRREVLVHERLVAFGQNVSAGSYIGGFTKGIQVKPSGRIINSTNSENSLCGFGFGLMLRGVDAVFFMKQLDFLLLGIDQLVDTYNVIRNMPEKPKGSFSIMTIVVDQGYQGPHSSLNNFADISSLARIDGFTITNKWDAEAIIPTKMVSPGFRIIAVSQRLFKEELIVPNAPLYRNDDLTLFQYDNGEDATIVCFNFSLPQGWALRNAMREKGMNPSLFNVNSPTPITWEKILESLKATRKLVLLDDSKSQNLPAFSLLAEVGAAGELKKRLVLVRKLGEGWFTPNADQLEIDVRRIAQELAAA